jgi:hypothetical protein
MLTPVMSAGSRSGVNWMRLTLQSTLRARARASIVLPTPGTSSMRRCPSLSSTVTAVSMTGRLPSMTVSIAAMTARASSRNSAGDRAGVGTSAALPACIPVPDPE